MPTVAGVIGPPYSHIRIISTIPSGRGDGCGLDPVAFSDDLSENEKVCPHDATALKCVDS